MKPSPVTRNPSRRLAIKGLCASVFSVLTDANTGLAQTPPEPRILRAEPILRKMKGDLAKEATINAYSGSMPGPLLRLKKGEPLHVRLSNALPAPTSLHWYGVRGPNSMDGTAGLTQPPVKPGETFDYNFTPPDSGMFWYHPLARGSAAEQVDRGLSGLLIVEEPDAPGVDQDLAIIIDDWRLTPDGEIISDFNSITDMARGGRLGNFLSVNGLAAPQQIIAQPGGRIRLRFLNATNARICPLKFENINAHVIAIDGQPCDPFDPLRRTVIMAPGSRFDIIVDIPADEGQRGDIGISLGVVLPLLSILSKGNKLASRPALVPLAGNGLPPGILLQNAVRTELVIAGGLPRPATGEPQPDDATLKAKFSDPTRIWQLNGGALGGFATKPLMSVKRGTPVVINLVNRTAWPQVIHVHGHNFRLLHAFDDGWEPYFLDTLFMAEGRSALISFVADNPGKWAIRSSILEHFEGGVVTWFEVL